MKRKGETFAEFLTAAAVFGVMMAGIIEFMANQTDNLAKIRHMDDMMYYANWLNMQTLNGEYNGVTVQNRNILFNIDHSVSADAILTTQYYQDNVVGRIDATEPNSPVVELEKIINFDWDIDTHTLTVMKSGGVKMNFKLKP